jgi:DNA-binding protein HU-beta
VSVNKAELIDGVAGRLGIDKRTANNAVEAVVDTIQRAVAAGEKVAITGFGVFEKIERPARMGRNPATGETVKVKKRAVPKFRPGTEFKDVVSGARKLAKAGQAAARSVGTSARQTARTAASTPRKAASAAQRAASSGGRKRTTTKKTTTKKTTARKTSPRKTTRSSTRKATR